MIICLPWKAEGVGGPFSFARLLKAGLEKKGHTITATFSKKTDVVLVFSECSLALALRAKYNRIRIVQRLDGLYHPGLPGKNGYLYFLKNLRAYFIHHFLADAVIYQSEFSKRSVLAVWGWIHPRHEIIYNGTPVSPLRQSKELHTPVRLFAHARWRREDQLAPLVRVLEKLPKKYELTIVGPVASRLSQLQEQLMTTPRVSWLPAATTDELTTFLDEQDIFLFADQSACPNSVLEALAARLPVVAFDRGGVGELVDGHRTGEIVSVAPYDPFRENYRFSDTDIERYAEAIKHVTTMYLTYQTNLALALHPRFTMTTVIDHYEKVLRPGA